ncbi:unnamed protein product [Trichobilharzia regenti]|nr:unnamed protein product [Trichobilharzia regenti]
MKSRFEKNDDSDNDVIIGDGGADGDVEAADYIPICLLSYNCSHLQCFDLNSYLTMNLRRPRWTCPICNTHSPFRDLRVDELFMSIIQDPRSANLEFVHMDSNGDWHVNNLPSTNAATATTTTTTTTNATSATSTPTKNDSLTVDKCPPTEIKSTDDEDDDDDDAATSNNNNNQGDHDTVTETDAIVKDKTENTGGGNDGGREEGESGNSPEKSQLITMNESKEMVTSVDNLEATTATTTTTTTTTTTPTATTATGVRENRHSEEPIVIILSDDDDDDEEVADNNNNENDNGGDVDDRGGEKNEEGCPSNSHQNELRNDNGNMNSTDKSKNPVRDHSLSHINEKVNGTLLEARTLKFRYPVVIIFTGDEVASQPHTELSLLLTSLNTTGLAG